MGTHRHLLNASSRVPRSRAGIRLCCPGWRIGTRHKVRNVPIGPGLLGWFTFPGRTHAAGTSPKAGHGAYAMPPAACEPWAPDRPGWRGYLGTLAVSAPAIYRRTAGTIRRDDKIDPPVAAARTAEPACPLRHREIGAVALGLRPGIAIDLVSAWQSLHPPSGDVVGGRRLPKARPAPSFRFGQP